ncbi:hypothetical protein EMIT0324P_120006 [Pseudomonas chlororaphis]
MQHPAWRDRDTPCPHHKPVFLARSAVHSESEKDLTFSQIRNGKCPHSMECGHFEFNQLPRVKRYLSQIELECRDTSSDFGTFRLSITTIHDIQNCLNI